MADHLTPKPACNEALHEIYAPPEAADHPYYDIVSPEWASRWPAEELWVARRHGR